MMELNAKGINTTTVAITDYHMTSDKVARVILSYTGDPSAEEITANLCKQLKHMAAPVEKSFRIIRAGVAIGYVRANTPVRVIENEKELTAGYKVIASNIMMDKEDESLWEVRKGAGGTFLARHGTEDLSELVGASLNPRSGVPRMNHIAQASVAKREFVAFASQSGDMDYGFCVAANAKQGKLKVVSVATREAIVIPHEAVASVIPVGPQGLRIPRETHNKIMASGIDRASVEQEIAYYKRLYGYDQAYLDEVIQQVEGTAAM
jgi:hypothetical protein